MTKQSNALATESQGVARTPTEKSLATRDDTLYVAPPVDIYETENALVVDVDLPGVNKDNVDIRIADNLLTIKGKVDYDPPAHLLRGEFSLQGYYRQFQLSDEIDQRRISAESKNGVLTIRLHKTEKSLPKQIEVKVG